MSGPLVLAIESSCDETGVALIEGGRTILANVVASQIALHAASGGIVPEVAARAHLRWIVPALDEAWADAGVTWSDIDAVAVTYGPGLAGSLLVGINMAKALAWVHEVPLVGGTDRVHQQLCRNADAGEHIVEVVGDSPGKLTHDTHLLGVP